MRPGAILRTAPRRGVAPCRPPRSDRGAERRPIPAGTGGQHRVVGGSRFLVAPQREERQAAELVEHGIVGHLRDGLIRLGQRGRIVALHEGIPRRIEQWRRLLLGGQTRLGAGRRGSRLGHHDRLRVIEVRCRRRTIRRSRGCSTANIPRTRESRKCRHRPSSRPPTSPPADNTKSCSSCRANPRDTSRRGSNRHASAGRGCSSG